MVFITTWWSGSVVRRKADVVHPRRMQRNAWIWTNFDNLFTTKINRVRRARVSRIDATECLLDRTV